MREPSEDPLAAAPPPASRSVADEPLARPRTARLRVCHLITRLICGGAQRIALETVCFLAAQGWDVELWAGPETGPEGSLWEEASRRGVRLRQVPDLRRAVAPLHDARALAWLTRAFRREAFDLVHTHSSKAGILGRLAAARAGVPLRVHSVHGWAMTPASGAPARMLYTLLERLAARRSHALIAVSAAVRDAGLARGIGLPGDYEVIHGAVSAAPRTDAAERACLRRELGLPLEAVVLGTIGRLDHAKDPLGTWEALSPLVEGDPNLWTVFVGDGPLRDALAGAIARAPGRERVRLAGLKPCAAAFLPAFDLFFLGSRWEGFPLAVLEAMACGLPVVAYRVAGIGEAVLDGETGFLVAPGDGALWRRRAGELAASREMRERFGAAARQRVTERFDLKDMLAGILALYDRWAVSAPEAPSASRPGQGLRPT
jgi:glycosyltransferase involved in cell wall biosynthesis